VARRYEPQPELGAAIRDLRERQAGLTQAEVARRAALEPAWLSRIESGTANPSWGTVRRICDALGVRLADVAALADPERPRGGRRRN
jgi:transcriptional regulator with XRE-family HTH domain